MIRKVLIFILFIQVQCAFSQDTIVHKKDIKVGLVLSGGGAKGFAHIGVLKVLEEAGVRIDYIGGTSMGAMIGALYSSGYLANELDSIVTSIDYTDLMQDNLPRRSKSIYQKVNSEKYALALPLKNGKLALPSAVSKGQNIFNMLSRLTEHVHTINDFSKLPIPFFCIATNLENGDTEILETGFLPEAIKASGSFPTLLDPVEINGKLLTDGGVVNNFPVDIMRQKGVDLIIGVDVQDKLKGKENLNSAPNILMQIVNFQMYDELELKRKDTDLYMQPDISNYNVVSFDLAREIIDNGEKLARKQMNYLNEIANNQTKKKLYIKEKHNYNKREILDITKITISGNNNYTPEYVLGKLKMEEGTSMSYKKFNEGIDNLSATGNFKSIEYRFLQNEEGLELQFDLNEEDESTFLQFGVHYDDLYKTGALLNFTSKHAIFDNDVLSADLILGDNVRYNIDYFIDNGFHWSYGINTRYNKFEKSFFESLLFEDLIDESNISKIPLNYNDFTTQLFLQTAFNSDIALRIGIEDKYIRISYESLINNIPEKLLLDNTNYLNVYSNLLVDTFDDKNFPKKGIFLSADYKAYLLASSFVENFNPFSQLKGKLAGVFTVGDKFTTHIVSEAGITIGNTNSRIFDYILGGNNQNFINNFTGFYGYDVGDLGESAYLKTTVTFRYELFKNHFTSFIANAARAEEDLFNKGAIFDNTKTGYAAGYGIKSPIGPIEVKYSWSPDTSQNYWFFNVGFWF